MLAMLGNEDKTVRAEPVNIIQRIRHTKEGNQDGERESVQEFHLPRCSFAAISYTDLITLKNNRRGNSVNYLTDKKGYLEMH